MIRAPPIRTLIASPDSDRAVTDFAGIAGMLNPTLQEGELSEAASGANKWQQAVLIDKKKRS
jgi:hypothetical protein